MKNNNKLVTISIGTSALNEENMISNFLQSILNQEQRSFRLEKIIINSDGSTDNTTKIAKSFNNKHIVILDNKKRKGKTTRIMEIFKANKSDILIILDTDMLLSSTETLENVVRTFKYGKVGMAGLNAQPIKSKTFVGKRLYQWEKIWFQVRKGINKGETILSLRGGAFAIKGDLAKQLIIPQTIHQIAEYLYHSIKKKGYLFKFAANSYAYYRQPETFADYISAISRGDKQDVEIFTATFGKDILKEYDIPREQKYKSLFTAMLHAPFSLFMTLVFIYIARIVSRNKNNIDKHGFWPVTQSTKKAFTLRDI